MDLSDWQVFSQLHPLAMTGEASYAVEAQCTTANGETGTLRPQSVSVDALLYYESCFRNSSDILLNPDESIRFFFVVKYITIRLFYASLFVCLFVILRSSVILVFCGLIVSLSQL